MHYLAMETVELVLSDSCSEENIVYSGEEFVPVDLKVNLSDSDNNIFIFINGVLCLDSSCFAVVTEKGK